ncbi:hypothetical protein EQM14_06365 [Caproiciproducens sp. NJN-50]|uniref:hypothetical protein n=2 Tax=Acutalibacteraceae TaxID=3082771 RepID=UPI000FFE30AB|nr:hypothetical protein [Caproiciproducens sp. NJN-50]QAT49427.1 hypothetical protein EQM14_06365 [Caproiciproducens sp. NJN-50]
MMSEARIKANRKYLKKMDDVIFRVKKGRKAQIKARAESLGMSLNAYMNSLIDRDMETHL